MNRREAERRGRHGERIAALWLAFRGWRILARRIRTKMGEVDLVCRKGRTVAFVEVKRRADRAARDRALDEARLRRVAAAANALPPRFARKGDDIRIDAVLLAPRSLPRHIANVWQPGRQMR